MTDEESSQANIPMIPYPLPYIPREMYSTLSGMD